MNYFGIVSIFLLAAAMAGAFTAISHILGPKRPSKVKYSAYECGVDPVALPRRRFNVKFYLIAILFILFDIETVFLVPWAVIYKQALVYMGAFIFWEMVVFVAILAVGLIYVWKKGALEWD